MSKEIKASLKVARNLLKDGQYGEALKLCQQLLKQDKDNYTTWVFLAASMKEIDEYKTQVPVGLGKAINLQPENPLAWNGLVSYYEKQPDNLESWNALLPAYCKLLQIDRTSSKFSHIVEQIGRLTIKINRQNTACDVIKSLEMLYSLKEKNEVKKINETLATIFLHYPKIAEDFPELYRDVLACVIHSEDFPKRLDVWKRHLKLLFAERKYTGVFGAAAKMHEQYPRELYPLEWICRIYAEQKVLEGPEFGEGVEIQQFYNALLKLDWNSSLGIFSKAMHIQQTGNIIDARDLLNQTVFINPQQLYAWIALMEINAKLRCWTDVENAAQSASKLLNGKSTHTQNKVNIYLIEAMAKGDNKLKWEKSLEECEKLLHENPAGHLKLLLAHAKVRLEMPGADSLLSELENCPETQIEAIILRAMILKKRGNLEEAIDVLGCALETSEAWFLFGEINWKLENYSHSLMAFLKGVHADQHNWQCLVYLGHYYRERGNDLEKSRKCYQKALRINPNSDEAGAGLSTAYRLLKNTEANMQMLQRVTTADGGGPKWAWLQLGLQQLDQGEISQAIKSLRYVIRADPTDNHCWESLADAYWARGSHTSALKSYQRALELSPGSLYPMIQLANINLVLGLHEEAKEAFLQVLSQEQKYIPALKGLAETCLGLAVEFSKKQLLGRAKRHVQQAVDSLTDGIVENSNLSCLWKLLGDACYRAATFPEKYANIEVAAGLVKSNAKEGKVEIQRSELFSLCSRCYCRALSFSKDSSFLWHDLACCYLAQLRFNKDVIDQKSVAEKSLEAAKQAVRLNPSIWVHWNILGVISMNDIIKNYALAQHCWVMAIDREPNNAIAWTNLGTLYLHLTDPYRANEAFSRAQRADPEYENSWIGQGLIAESVKRREAMLLFRHANQLCFHPQAAIGYTHWVLSTVLDPEAKKDLLFDYTIYNMHFIPVAADAMTWYIEREPNSMVGRNALGLLLERQKLYKPAAQQFKAALKLSEDENLLDAVRINLARILVQMGDYEDAICICRDIKSPNFKSHCQLALSLFKAEKYEESYAAYEDALQWLAEDGSDKAHVLCAMAAMAYMFQDVDDVKTLLFQCIQIQPPTVAGLLAAAALGLLHADFNLTNLVLNELRPFQDDPKYRHHVSVISAYSCLINDNPREAISILSKAVHRHPGDVGSWVGLVRVLLETNSKGFGNCAQKALLLGRKTSTLAVAQVACIASLGQLLENQKETGLRSVQKTLMSFPGNIESWANLVVALTPRCNNEGASPNARWLLKLISIIQGKLKSTESMDEWLVDCHREISAVATTC